MHFESLLAARIRPSDIRRQNDVLSLRVLRPERRQIDGRKTVRRPLAFNRKGALPPRCRHEIDLVPALVPPVSDLAALQAVARKIELPVPDHEIGMGYELGLSL